MIAKYLMIKTTYTDVMQMLIRTFDIYVPYYTKLKHTLPVPEIKVRVFFFTNFVIFDIKGY